MSLRFGIIGCGNILKSHVNSLAKASGAHLEMVFDVAPEKARAAGETYGVPVAENIEQLLTNSDAVCVLVPSGFHCDLTVLAAEAGKHVLTEKPVDVTYMAALKMVETCERARVKLGCISQHRVSNDIQRLKAAIESGELGRIVQGDCYNKWYRSQAYYDSAGWRGTWAVDGGGCLMNQGVHYIDMIQWVMGGVRSVRALTRTMSHQIEVEDTAIALVEYNNGAIGVIQGSTATYPGFPERLEVHGTKGSVVIEGDRARVWEQAPEVPEAFGRTAKRFTNEELSPDPTAVWDAQHPLQVQDFVDSVREDREPLVSGRDALEPLKVILAIYESSRRNGEEVVIQEHFA